MFGKGIYFADQSSKSAQYPLTTPTTAVPTATCSSPTWRWAGSRRNTRLYREEAPDGYHSVQGCQGPSLIHNEFIIYKTAQCTLRYIAEIEQA